jgi:hypothetical protein
MPPACSSVTFVWPMVHSPPRAHLALGRGGPVPVCVCRRWNRRPQRRGARDGIVSRRRFQTPFGRSWTILGQRSLPPGPWLVRRRRPADVDDLDPAHARDTVENLGGNSCGGLLGMRPDDDDTLAHAPDVTIAGAASPFVHAQRSTGADLGHELGAVAHLRIGQRGGLMIQARATRRDQHADKPPVSTVVHRIGDLAGHELAVPAAAITVTLWLVTWLAAGQPGWLCTPSRSPPPRRRS